MTGSGREEQEGEGGKDIFRLPLLDERMSLAEGGAGSGGPTLCVLSCMLGPI